MIKLVCDCGNKKSFEVNPNDKGGVYVMCKRCGEEIQLKPEESK